MNRSKNGFTLIELLLGLTIFSIIALCVYSTFSGGIRLSHRSAVQNEIYRDARWSLNLMAEELENMVSYDFGGSYPDKSSFAGSQHEITFLSATNDGLKVISYYLIVPEGKDIHKIIVGQTYSKNVSVVTRYEETTNINYLVRAERSFVDFLNETSEDTLDIEIISTNVKENGLRFFYGYLESTESKSIVWRDTWDEGYIPLDVRIEIDFLPTGGKSQSVPFVKDILIPTGFLGIMES